MERVESMLIAKFQTCGVASKIAALEGQYGIEFPKPYREFLLRYNGGYTPKTSFRAKGISSDLRGFYGLGTALSADREAISRWVPQGLFPMACDYFGNTILLSLSGAKAGSVFFSDHERGEALSPLADDLPAFLRTCKSEKIPEAARRSIEERKAALIQNGRGHVITPALIEMWQKELEKYGSMQQEEVLL